MLRPAEKAIECSGRLFDEEYCQEFGFWNRAQPNGYARAHAISSTDHQARRVGAASQYLRQRHCLPPLPATLSRCSEGHTAYLSTGDADCWRSCERWLDGGVRVTVCSGATWSWALFERCDVRVSRDRAVP
jgi:hypothetical protein